VSAAPPPDGAFFSHPRGLFFLAFTEAWERFSFYGMTAPLVLYMVNQLLLPGQVENVLGFAANNLVGWLGRVYEHLGPEKFWVLQAAIAACGGVCVLLFSRALARVLADGAGQPMRPAAKAGMAVPSTGRAITGPKQCATALQQRPRPGGRPGPRLWHVPFSAPRSAGSRTDWGRAGCPPP